MDQYISNRHFPTAIPLPAVTQSLWIVFVKSNSNHVTPRMQLLKIPISNDLNQLTELLEQFNKLYDRTYIIVCTRIVLDTLLYFASA